MKDKLRRRRAADAGTVGKTHGTVALVRLAAGRAETPTETETGSGGQPDAATDDGKLKEDYTSPTLGMAASHPAGQIPMGSPKDEDGRESDEGPQHEVEITKPFYMGVYPVTRRQFAAFVKDDGYQTSEEKGGFTGPTWRNPDFSAYNQTDNDPVVCVSRDDAVKFCEWLSGKEKRNYGLPTEAEWEYTCRAGTTTAFSFPDRGKLGDYAWYEENSGGHTRPVGQKRPNPWGLYDMHGNVAQWCADFHRAYSDKYAKDPEGLVDANGEAVIRGGNWELEPRYCRSAARGSDNNPNDGTNTWLGYRVVLRPAARTP